MKSKKKRGAAGRSPWPLFAVNGRLVLAALVLAAAVTAFYLLVVKPEAARNPNVLLITLDTLRADRLGCYGYSRAHTPHLDRLAAEGARFQNAISQVPLTLPSHATMFTGTYPARHSIRDNGGFFLKPGLKTLAELARERGYRTAGFVSAFVLDSKWGLDRGFETYFDQFDLSRYERISLGSVQRVAEETVEELLPWLEAAAGSPFFAWVHLFDPHAPYQPPEPFASDFRERPYDGEVAYVDAAVGRVLRFLESRGLDGSTVVVVAGDHGEGLGEHRELTHGNFVYDSTLRVPLLMRFPGKRHAGVVVREQVGLIDLFSTLGDVMGASVPSQNQGRSLLPRLRGEELTERPLLAESFYPRLHYGWGEVIALRTGRFKYIDTPRPELFDLQEDPGETRNLFPEKTALARQIKTAFDRLWASEPAPAVAPAPLDPESERRLRALGYIGATAPATNVDRRELPDPKDKIELIHAISRADALGAAGRLEEAIGLLRQALAEDPGILDAHLSLGNKLSEAGRYEEAIAEFRRCLELNPEYDLALTNLALVYKRAKRFEEAEVGFRRILERDRENRQALFNLGEIFLFKKDYGKALEAFRKGLAQESDSPIFLRQAGIAYYYLGQFQPAESILRQAIAARQEIDSAHFTLGLMYEKQGRLAEAEAEYMSERQIHPQHLKAIFNLARLYGSQRRYEEQIEALEQAVRIDPNWAIGFFHLAKAYRDSGRSELYPKAMAAAEKGLALDPDSNFAPLAHFIRAEILERTGRQEEARRALARGKALDARKR